MMSATPPARKIQPSAIFAAIVDTSGKRNRCSAGQQQHDADRQEPAPVGRDMPLGLGNGRIDIGL